MEHSKFLAIVDELLEPQVKSTAQRTKIPFELRRDASIILKAKPRLEHCDDCSESVMSRRCSFVRKIYRNPYQENHWQKRCENCQKSWKIDIKNT